MKNLKLYGQLAMAAGLLLAATAGRAQTATLTDLGPTSSYTPTPGTYDISQLAVPAGANSPGGLNYYTDNATPPGQTFLTGSSPNGYVLTSLAIATAGNGGGLSANGQVYQLWIYAMSGKTATLVATINSQPGFVLTASEADWLQWTGLGITLQPNTQYAYAFGRISSGAGWMNMANITGGLYPNGQVGLFPKGSGSANFGSATGYSASFDIGLSLPSAPIPLSPASNPTYSGLGIPAGTKVTLTASAAGLQPITYQWQTDSGSGGALANIPGATSTNLLVDTTGWAPGTYQYDYVAVNGLGNATSATAAIVIVSQAMVDVGTNAPTPGPNDVSQLVTGNVNQDGLNYYTDNGASHGNWSGQSFTTGTNNNGYLLQNLYWLSGGGSASAFSTWQLYDLYIYQVSGNFATLVSSYQMYGGGTSGDWLEFTGLSTPLAPNAKYAFTFGRDATATGWQSIYSESGNPYPGGQTLTIANASITGGPITYGTTGNSDAVFDLSLVISQKPNASTPTYTPFVNPIYGNTPVTLSEAGVGTPPLSYQWLSDNGTGGALTPVSGATGTNLVVTLNGSTSPYNYAVIVKNSFGSSTSAPVTLNFTAPSIPQVVSDISPIGTNQGYVGQTLSFATSFTGTLPITYQWYYNSNAISSASNPSAASDTLVLSNLQPGNAGAYYVIAQNSQGSQSSSTTGLGVLTPPGPPAANTYAALVLSENPVAYWRFNETGDPSSGVLPAYDATGNNFDGLYGASTLNGFDGVVGPQSPTFPGLEANNSALGTQSGDGESFVNVPPLNLNTNTVTFTAWINPAGAVAASSGIVFNRTTGVGGTAAGFCFGNTVNASGVAELGYTWDTNSAATYNYNSGLYPVPGIWSFVALVIQTNQAKLYLYYIDPATGQPDLYSAVNPVPNGPEPFTGATNTTIGTDLYNSTTRLFNGDIDEVAVFNSALSDAQILGQFSKATGIGPVAASISGQPSSTTVYAGKTVTLAATGINGTPTITYQWQFNGANLNDGGNISGSHTPTLTISNIVAADSGTYVLQASNPVGTTPSSNAVVTVVNPVPNSYESAVLAANPFAYWKLNETVDPSTGTAVAIDYAGGHNGLYQTAAQNGFNGVVGPEAPEFAGFPTVNTALETFNGTAASYVAAGSAGSLVATNLTYVMWINPSVANGDANGLLFDRGGAGEGLCINNNSVNADGQGALGYTWNQNNSDTWSWSSGIYPTVGEWQLVAMVITPTAGTLYLIDSNGVQSATNAIPHDAETFGSAWQIGNDTAGGTGGGRTFPGSIADVSVYLYALTGNQIATLYNAGVGVIPPVTLNITSSGSGTATLTWSQGTLLQSSSLAGPWTTVTTTSPYTVGTTNASTFFRVKVQ